MPHEALKICIERDGQLIKKVAIPLHTPTVLTVGRDAAQTDIALESTTLSGVHLQLIVDENGRLYLNDMGSTNGSWINGRRLTPHTPTQLQVGDRFQMGSNQLQAMVLARHAEYAPPRSAASSERDPAGNAMPNGKLLIGRLAHCDLVIDHPSVSREHAVLEPVDSERFRLRDLGSLNGTFVNGQRLRSPRVVTRNDLVLIGHHRIDLEGQAHDLTEEVAVKTENLEKKYPNGFVGLHATTLTIPSRSLLAVMGPSGCGKSTLMKALNGENPASSGRVELFGLELQANYEYLKAQIGYVPQDDSIHRELTVYECLYYAARLRIQHPDKEQIQAKIDEVLHQLNIQHIKHNRVAKISGGQRKRVSIAVELLTDPLILFLDEPTSPLDPQTIAEFMGILKKLTAQGTTVVMVTHKPEDLHYMDHALFLAEGGHVVYHGAADQYTRYFQVRTPVEVYANISGPAAAKWIGKHRGQAKRPPQHTQPAAAPATSRTRANALRQFWWLTLRYFNIKTNDRVNSAFMVLQAPIIAFLICLIFDHLTQPVLFLMAISGIWFGTNNAAREIVGEKPIYARERMFNLRLFPYIGSKVVVLTLFSVVQAIAFTFILYFWYRHDTPALAQPTMVLSWMVLITLSATLLGLLLSAMVNSSEKVMTLVPLALIPQIMLAGVVAPITSPVVEYLSYLTLSRWGTEGLTAIQQEVYLDVPQPTGAVDSSGMPVMDTVHQAVDGIGLLHQNFHDDYAFQGKAAAQILPVDCYALVGLSVLFLAGIWVALRRRDVVG